MSDHIQYRHVLTAPEKVWLNVSDERGDVHEPFPVNKDDVTWNDGPVAAMFVAVPYVRADLVAAKDERIAFLERALEQAAAFADMRVVHVVDDRDQRAGFTLSCTDNDVEIPRSAYDDLADYLREKGPA